jgi:hypothetical protein
MGKCVVCPSNFKLTVHILSTGANRIIKGQSKEPVCLLKPVKNELEQRI